MMKAHIFFAYGKWWCSHLGIRASGESMKIAYMNCISGMYNQANPNPYVRGEPARSLSAILGLG